ncbi:Hypothetical protein Cp262_2058 [Corynebacterium pseudotuberculosis]|nr:Hypothetical protein Cp226_2191 [Corynebacterium pseudotuberculosis]AKP09678.1 Hypothetical protein Cp262_2058 [Corynebacterium pseudotuberculosis]AKS14441.1 Hypothetical protein CpE19_2107 [Corynebacterium pseudotuberculosis]
MGYTSLIFIKVIVVTSTFRPATNLPLLGQDTHFLPYLLSRSMAKYTTKADHDYSFLLKKRFKGTFSRLKRIRSAR